MSDTFNEIGFTEQQEAAILAALEAVGLKPGANRERILFEIVTYLVDLHDNPLVVNVSVVEKRLKTMRRGLEAFLHAYTQDDAESEVLKLHLYDQKMIPTSCAECDRRKLDECEALRTEEIQFQASDPARVQAREQEQKEWMKRREEQKALEAEHPEVKDLRLSESDPQPDENPYTPERYVASLLAAVRKAQTHSIHPMIAIVEKSSNRLLNLAVWRLLEIFERETDVRPTVHKNQPRKVRDAGTEKNAEVIYGGTFLPFAVACLSPVNFVPRKSLNSAILTAYEEWNQKRSPSRHTRNEQSHPLVILLA